MPAAIAYAIAALSAGDVILIEHQLDYQNPNTPTPDFIPIEWWTNNYPNAQTYNGVYAAIVNAVANGIHVVEAGGNGGEVAGSGVNTDSLSWYGNSGAIIVGAGGAYAGGTWSEGNLERLSFSSYGQRFDLQGLGENVVTTGYGTLYLAEGKNYYYASDFSGTSSAAPIVAGAVACCVGRWKASVSPTPPPPSYIRSLLKNTGTPQFFGLAGNIGPRPNLLAAFGQMGLAWSDATSGPLADTGNGTSVAWGDYDNDGDLDIYHGRGFGSANKLFRNDGGGMFVDATVGPLGDVGSHNGCVFGDFDNDGDLDLFLSKTSAEADVLLRNDGGGAFTDVSTPLFNDLGNGASAAWADYDNDGDLDLYLANYGEANRLFRNESGSAKRWIHVLLAGSVSNRNGIGARVRLVSSMGAQIREVNAGSGHNSQDSPAAEFGLGSLVLADTITVRWPSGIVSVLTNVAADQVIVVNEVQTSVSGGALSVPSAFRIHANAPNPFNPATAIRFELSETGPARLAVYDVSGRLVTTLFAESGGAGSHTAIRDGTTDRGIEAAPGVYLLRLEAADRTAVRKITLVK
ncbi:MAG: VCBS repeat-containing protein [Candidatus Eisenbacteria bacterium]|nr:VCBS repeat-containing protein [Candidatus Eisenbacteria bacterium]